jgi:hypothetical protein
MAVKMKLADGTNLDNNGNLPVRKIQFPVNPDATVEVPRWAIPDMLAKGAIRVDGVNENINMAIELLKADGSELSNFLNSRGVRDHRWDAATHFHSAELRSLAENGCVKCGHVHPHEGIDAVDGSPKTYALLKMVADDLDHFHRMFHKGGPGRIVVLSDDEKRQKAMEILKSEQKK